MNGSYMSLLDWAILVIPVVFVMCVGFYSRRYIRGVSDYLACGRVCGRYVLCMGDVANALSIITLVAFVEMKYSTGFALGFWYSLLTPLLVFLGLSGYCVYRFRETRSMSLGQFLEIRYSRKLRIFAAGLRSLAEVLANMIMPAVAARFFIQMLNLPASIPFLGMSIPTFELLMILFLSLAITLICWGGTLALVVTDTIQGMILCPLLVSFIIFILLKFSWSEEVIPVMLDRVPGESFINPLDIEKLPRFNFFTMVICAGAYLLMHSATWIGAGNSCAAKSAHEQRMAGVLAGFRSHIIGVFQLLVAICLIVFLNHKNFAPEANLVRQNLATRAVNEVVKDTETRERVLKTIAAIKPIEHEIGVDAPLGNDHDIDSAFLEHIHNTLKEDAVSRTRAKLKAENAGRYPEGAELEAKLARDRAALNYAEGEANNLFQQCRTLFTQLNLSATMRQLLPGGLFGAFCLLLFLAMLSTDDTRIFSSALTISQDCILPFIPGGLPPEKHIRMIRIVTICIGVFFFFGSKYMSQLEYIELFSFMAVSVWTAGCGPMMVLGLYWKKGTTKAAWTALLTGMIISVAYVLTDRNWRELVYPFLLNHNMTDALEQFLQMVSMPFGSFLNWHMDPQRFPINSIEYIFFVNILTLLVYIAVSLLTCKENFNMDRMLHRGQYAIPGEHKDLARDWSLRGIFKTLVGITPEYTKGDRLIAYAYFFYNFVFVFLLSFVAVAVWNAFTPWKIEYWSIYFLVTALLVPLIIAGIATVWFFFGGVRDLVRLFRDLGARKENILDDGRVDGNVSLADKQDS